MNKISIFNVRKRLESLADKKYKDFSSALCPGTEKTMIGVRVPQMRTMAKEIASKDWRSIVANEFTFDIFEEVMLYGLIISYAKMPLDEHLEEIKRYVKMITNWSLCDIVCSSMTIARKKPEEVWNFLEPYLQSDKEFEQRFGVVMLLDHFINDKYIARVIKALSNVKSKTYYSMMAIAWALSVCFVKYPQQTLPLLESGGLNSEVLNKTLQKILESRRTPKDMRPIIQALKKRKR